ncbi:MAG TPA: hypothetical protein PKG95_05750 [Anaerolineaceae bacterium]|nr:hypothetical protein [Anaerolineaceae bacterium]
MTPAVLISFSGLAFIYIVVIGNDVAFLKYLGMILPIDSQGTGTITGKDIMRVYSVATTALFGVSVLWQVLAHRLKHGWNHAEPIALNLNLAPEGTPAPRRRLPGTLKRIFNSSLLITAIFAAVFTVLPQAPMAAGSSVGGLVLVMILLFSGAIVSNAIFIGIDVLSNKIIGQGLSKIADP